MTNNKKFAPPENMCGKALEVIRNNVAFQQKQLDLITNTAKHYGVEIRTAEIHDEAQVDIDFDIDYMQAHHFELFQIVEYIISAMNTEELNIAEEKIKEFFKSKKEKLH